MTSHPSGSVGPSASAGQAVASRHAREPHVGVAVALALTLVAAALLGADEARQPGEPRPAPRRADAGDAGEATPAGRLDFDVAAVTDHDEALAARLAEEPRVLEPLARAARTYEVDTELVLALAWHESRWRPEAVSPAGAVGVMQVMPGTAERVVAADALLQPPVDLTSPGDNARVGAAYIARMLDRYDGDPRTALQAYNQGPTPIDAGRPSQRAIGYAQRVLATADALAAAR